ncbi:MAG: hypothetical protein HKN36_08835 [Hellea sp.]|nr:hypothetical protein [Hellea sp.]
MLRTIFKILVWIFLLLLLYLIIIYTLYRIDARSYGTPFVRLAHIVAPHNHYPNCVPEDDFDRFEEDYNDAWAKPEAQATLQHLEWLGQCVTEEKRPLRFDGYDDGIGTIELVSGNWWAPGSTLKLKIVVSTTYSYHKSSFPKKGKIVVYTFIDWNNNKTFEDTELVDTWSGRPPFNNPVDINGTLYETSLITVPANYKGPQGNDTPAPPMRLHMIWAPKGKFPAVPYPYNEFGEIEDYDDSQEELEP